MKYTVLIPVTDRIEFNYLRLNLFNIERYTENPSELEIIVADQSGFVQEITSQFKNLNIKIINLPRIDAGYPIDRGLEIANGEVFFSMDCDAFPISNQWLEKPASFLQDSDMTFVGASCGFASEPVYSQHGNFTIINNYFRACRTEFGKSISKAVGFMRPTSRSKVGFVPEVSTPFDNQFADNGVIANWYIEKVLKSKKKTILPVNRYTGQTLTQGKFGFVVDDLIWHASFGFVEDWIPESHQAANLGEICVSLRRKVQELSETSTKKDLEELSNFLNSSANKLTFLNESMTVTNKGIFK